MIQAQREGAKADILKAMRVRTRIEIPVQRYHLLSTKDLRDIVGDTAKVLFHAGEPDEEMHWIVDWRTDYLKEV